MVELKIRLTPGQLMFLHALAHETADRASKTGNMATALVAMEIWESLDKQLHTWEREDTANVD